MSQLRNYREESRKNYCTSDETLTLDHLKAGAILRIADAAELMVKNFLDLQAQNKQLAQRLQFWEDHAKNMDRKVYALKGVITKMKAKPKK